eukprot:jgi/Mesvir1/16354/Mv18102-RA.1
MLDDLKPVDVRKAALLDSLCKSAWEMVPIQPKPQSPPAICGFLVLDGNHFTTLIKSVNFELVAPNMTVDQRSVWYQAMLNGFMKAEKLRVVARGGKEQEVTKTVAAEKLEEWAMDWKKFGGWTCRCSRVTPSCRPGGRSVKRRQLDGTFDPVMVREHVFGVKLKGTFATDLDKFIADCRLTRDFWRVVVTATRAIILTLRDLPPAKRKVVDQKDWKFPRGLLASHPRHLYDDLGVKTKHLLGVPVEAAAEEEVEEEEEGKGTTKAKKGWRDRLEAYSDWKGAFAVLDLAADSNEKWRNLRKWDQTAFRRSATFPNPPRI